LAVHDLAKVVDLAVTLALVHVKLNRPAPIDGAALPIAVSAVRRPRPSNELFNELKPEACARRPRKGPATTMPSLIWWPSG